MAKNPQQVAANWASRLGQSTQAITDGVQGVQVAPGTAAARQKAVWQQNTAAAANKWASNVSKVSLTDWQQAMINKGVPRIAQGATASVPKMEAFMAKLLPYVESQRAALPPRGDLSANINRMVTFVQGMSKFSNS